MIYYTCRSGIIHHLPQTIPTERRRSRYEAWNQCGTADGDNMGVFRRKHRYSPAWDNGAAWTAQCEEQEVPCNKRRSIRAMLTLLLRNRMKKALEDVREENQQDKPAVWITGRIRSCPLFFMVTSKNRDTSRFRTWLISDARRQTAAFSAVGG